MARRRLPEDNVPGLSDVVTRLSGGYTTIGELVYAILREAIVSGTLKPGQKLRQEAIAEAIGVSRIPVRSALLQLEAESLVTFTRHRGAMVRLVSGETVRETYAVRAVLESYALKLSIRAMTPERAEKLLELADRLDQSDESSDFLADRTAFYHALYSAEDNPVLAGVIDQLRDSVGRSLLDVPSKDHRHRHRELAELVIAGDLPGARRLLEEHLKGVSAGIISVID